MGTDLWRFPFLLFVSCWFSLTYHSSSDKNQTRQKNFLKKVLETNSFILCPLSSRKEIFLKSSKSVWYKRESHNRHNQKQEWTERKIPAENIFSNQGRGKKYTEANQGLMQWRKRGGWILLFCLWFMIPLTRLLVYSPTSLLILVVLLVLFWSTFTLSTFFANCVLIILDIFKLVNSLMRDHALNQHPVIELVNRTWFWRSPIIYFGPVYIFLWMTLINCLQLPDSCITSK